MDIKAEKREEIGKQAAKKLRKEEKIPAVLYGHEEKPVPIWVALEDLRTLFKSLKSESEIFTLDVKGKKRVIIKDIQRDPITSELLHIDFQHLHRGEKIKAHVPIILEGESIGVEQGGILDQILREVTVEAIPREMPSSFTLDITDLKVGSSLHVRDIDSGNAKILEEPERTIVTILTPKVRKEEEEIVAEEELVEEELAEEEAVEEEKVGKEKKEEKEEKKERE
jgi:large subunit ribosomal protein L25